MSAFPAVGLAGCLLTPTKHYMRVYVPLVWPPMSPHCIFTPYIPAFPCQSPNIAYIPPHAHTHACPCVCQPHTLHFICTPACLCAHVHDHSTPSTALCSLLASVVGSFHFIHFITDSN